MLGELVDRVAAVAEDPLFTVYVGDRGRTFSRVGKAPVNCDQSEAGTQIADVDGSLPLSPHMRGEGQFVVSVTENRVRHYIPFLTSSVVFGPGSCDDMLGFCVGHLGVVVELDLERASPGGQ